MSLQFTDEEFQSAWKELDAPQLDGGWELFTETMGVQIHRLYDKETGLYEYKVFGGLGSCNPELCADVYMDLMYRKHWDGYVKELYEKDFGGQTAIYWEVKYPFPLSNRDYVYVRERRDLDIDGRKIWVILARSSPQTACAEKKGVLRVNDYKQSVALESDGASGTKDSDPTVQGPLGALCPSLCSIILLMLFTDVLLLLLLLGGSIWLFSLTNVRLSLFCFLPFQSGVPGFIKDLQTACGNYKTYCERK
ncbi:PREDICTED: phosphatidylcholine transfer protein [Cyprinodon variegatus]|uniref:phosphatidylcholine transfer protein n=1 Tax=Cyprinodon variegatus TaxID=28743 RepID=UPI0007429F85|nr:PREDICTED: phosphatidylcholine transfer protein [Cyprinodon variegatus]